MTKSSRLEFRLEDSLLVKIDDWRSDQPNLPSRGEAIRTLVLIGLSGDSGSSGPQLFELARTQVLSLTLSAAKHQTVPDAYLYAWDSGVYPLFHDGNRLHRPFADYFPVGKEMVAELTDLLDERERKGKVPTFYELEEMYGTRYGSTDWDRVSLIQTCRYMFLHHNMWGDNFWNRILAKMEHPAEAQSITRKFTSSDVSII